MPVKKLSAGQLTVPFDSRLCQDGFHASVVMLFRIVKAPSIHCCFIAADVSCWASNNNPLTAIVAADESAGRGGGIRGALKSQGTMPSEGRVSKKYVAVLRAVVR